MKKYRVSIAQHAVRVGQIDIKAKSKDDAREKAKAIKYTNSHLVYGPWSKQLTISDNNDIKINDIDE